MGLEVANPYLAGAEGLIGATQLITGIIGGNKAEKAFNKLHYNISPAVLNAEAIAKANAQHGFSGAERESFLQTIQRNNARKYHLATMRMGNNIAGTVQGAINNSLDSSYNQFATDDARLQRNNQQYADTFANEHQQIDNMNKTKDINHQQQKINAAGQAINAGINNLALGTLNLGSKAKGDGSTGGAATTTTSNNGALPAAGTAGYQASISPYGVGLPKDQWLQQNRMLYPNGDPTFGDPNFGMNPNYIPRNY